MQNEPTATVEILDLPWPVTLNKLYGYNPKTGRKYLSGKAKDYHWQVKAVVNNKIPFSIRPLTGRLHLDIYCYPPDKRRRHLDNLLKVMLDSLEYSQVFADDGQIDCLMIERRTPNKKPHIDIVIKEYPKLQLTKRTHQ